MGPVPDIVDKDVNTKTSPRLTSERAPASPAQSGLTFPIDPHVISEPVALAHTHHPYLSRDVSTVRVKGVHHAAKTTNQICGSKHAI